MIKLIRHIKYSRTSYGYASYTPKTNMTWTYDSIGQTRYMDYRKIKLDVVYSTLLTALLD